MDIVYCYQCESFDRSGTKDYHCKNSKGLMYPGPSDFCSRAVKVEGQSLDMKSLEETLQKVYQSRGFGK